MTDKAEGNVVYIFLLSLISLASFFTHVVYCINAANYLLLIAGSICMPVGVVHGVGLWFGFFG